MISKETFCKALELIHKQQGVDEQFSTALDLVGDGHFVYGANNAYLKALILVLQESMNDKYDYIGWWLYEATPDYKVWSEDEEKEWHLETAEALYDFIVSECQE